MIVLVDTISNTKQARRGFSSVELVLVLFVLTLMLGIISVSVISSVSKSRHNSDASRLVNFLQKSVQYAVLHQQDVELYIDLESGTYQAEVVYEQIDEFFTEDDDQEGSETPEADNTNSDDPESTIIGEPLEFYYIAKIQFEDATVMDGEIVLLAGGGGWQDSFVIELSNEEGTYEKWIRCDRGTANARLYSRPTNLPEPRTDID